MSGTIGDMAAVGGFISVKRRETCDVPAPHNPADPRIWSGSLCAPIILGARVAHDWMVPT
jgi:hypothetical protein